MFRLQPGNLPEDPKFPADLKALGFFINKVGQFRMIEYPDKDFNFHYSNNERVNEVRREAYQICQRREVLARLSALGLEQLYLPQLTYTKPAADSAFVPILAPPAEILRTRKRVIVLINDSMQDLGILAYRRLQRELGVNGGSVIDFAKELTRRSKHPSPKEEENGHDIFADGAGVDDKKGETPGLIVMNCGQLFFSYKHGEPKSVKSWSAMPRKSACHDPITISEANYIPGNRDAKEHIRFVFDKVIKNAEFVDKEAEVYVIAIENGAENLLGAMDTEFTKYSERITALAIIEAKVRGAQIKSAGLKKWLKMRAREWRFEADVNDPDECIEVPAGYNEEVAHLDSKSKDKKDIISTQTQELSWLETIKPQAGPAGVGDILSNITNGVKNLNPFATTSAFQSPPTDTSKPTADTTITTTSTPTIPSDTTTDPICPTFPDASNPHGAGECILTYLPVQHSILNFFSTVALNPAHYHNPSFFPATIPGTTPYQPGDFQTAADRQELESQKDRLQKMKDTLLHTPVDREELRAGRKALEKRIGKAEEEILRLEEEGRKAREASDVGVASNAEAMASVVEEESNHHIPEQTVDTMEPGKWQTVGGGPKIKVANAMVDRELLKATGLDDGWEVEGVFGG